MKRWRDGNRDLIRSLGREQRRILRDRKFGVALDTLVKLQHGRCALCETTQPSGRGWHLDHDHETGKVRGALCSNCNLGLGLLGDTVAALRNAVAYLERASDQEEMRYLRQLEL